MCNRYETQAGEPLWEVVGAGTDGACFLSIGKIGVFIYIKTLI